MGNSNSISNLQVNNPNNNNNRNKDINFNKDNKTLDDPFLLVWRNKFLKKNILNHIRIFNNNNHCKKINEHQSLEWFNGYIYRHYISSISIKLQNNLDSNIMFENVFKKSPFLKDLEIVGGCALITKNSFKNIKSIKFVSHEDSIQNIFPQYSLIFPNLVYVEFCSFFNYSGSILSSMLSLETLIFGKNFNGPIESLPPNLTYLYTGSEFNNNISLSIISKLKSIKFGSMFNQPIFNVAFESQQSIPKLSLTSIVFGSNYSCPISKDILKDCLINLTHLEFGISFDQHLPLLPSNLKSIVLNNQLDKVSVKSCSNSLTSIKFNYLYNKKVDYLKYAKSLETVEFGLFFSQPVNDIVFKIPSLTCIDISRCDLNQCFGIETIDLKKSIPNLKTLLLNKNYRKQLIKSNLPPSLTDIRCTISSFLNLKQLLCSDLPISSITFYNYKVLEEERKKNLIDQLSKNPIKFSTENRKFIAFVSSTSLIQFIPLSNVESFLFTCNSNSLYFILDQLYKGNSNCTHLYLSIKTLSNEIRDQTKDQLQQDCKLPNSLSNLYLLNFEPGFEKDNNNNYNENRYKHERIIIGKLWNCIKQHENLSSIYCLDSSIGFIDYFIENDLYCLLKVINRNQMNQFISKHDPTI